jgi:hypothetical protein
MCDLRRDTTSVAASGHTPDLDGTVDVAIGTDSLISLESAHGHKRDTANPRVEQAHVSTYRTLQRP